MTAITNREFVDTYIWISPDSLHLMDLVYKLSKKYGKKILMNSYKESLDSNMPWLHSFLWKLDNIKKYNVKDLFAMRQYIQDKLPLAQATYTVHADSATMQKVKWVFADVDCESHIQNWLWIKVAAKGKYYKRTLQSDIDTLLF